VDEIDLKNGCFAGFARVYSCRVPVNAAQTEIANDYVVIRFPDGLDVPREVQELLLERITESICYFGGFSGIHFPTPNPVRVCGKHISIYWNIWVTGI